MVINKYWPHKKYVSTYYKHYFSVLPSFQVTELFADYFLTSQIYDIPSGNLEKKWIVFISWIVFIESKGVLKNCWRNYTLEGRILTLRAKNNECLASEVLSNVSLLLFVNIIPYLYNKWHNIFCFIQWINEYIGLIR